MSDWAVFQIVTLLFAVRDGVCGVSSGAFEGVLGIVCVVRAVGMVCLECAKEPTPRSVYKGVEPSILPAGSPIGWTWSNFYIVFFRILRSIGICVGFCGSICALIVCVLLGCNKCVTRCPCGSNQASNLGFGQCLACWNGWYLSETAIFVSVILLLVQ